MSIRLLDFDLHILNMRNRMPFRYGIVTMTALPHLFLQARIEVDGRQADGIAAEGLAPKWFTKVPDSSMALDIAEMLDVNPGGLPTRPGSRRGEHGLRPVAGHLQFPGGLGS